MNSPFNIQLSFSIHIEPFPFFFFYIPTFHLYTFTQVCNYGVKEKHFYDSPVEATASGGGGRGGGGFKEYLKEFEGLVIVFLE